MVQKGPLKPRGDPRLATMKDYERLLAHGQMLITSHFDNLRQLFEILWDFITPYQANNTVCACSHESLSDPRCAGRRKRRDTMLGTAKEKNRIAQRAYRERQKVLSFRNVSAVLCRHGL